MVIPFSNTQLRVPKGFQSLLVGLSTEVLRSKPKNIHKFAAEYFEKLLQRRDQGQSIESDKQASLEDRYYNNNSFQEEYGVNDHEANEAARKIQAQFRGRQARQTVERMKNDSKLSGNAEEDDEPGFINGSDRSKTPEKPKTPELPVDEGDKEFPQYLSDVELQEQERAAKAIQARFRGFKARKSAESRNTATSEPAGHMPNEKYGNRENSSDDDSEHHGSSRPSPRISSARHNANETSMRDDQSDSGNNGYSDTPRLEREHTQLSQDFEGRNQVRRSSDIDREASNDLNNEDMRGSRSSRSVSSHNSQPHISLKSPPPGEFENIDHEGESSMNPNQVLHEDDDDNVAAIKIQAAFRGYRTRKDLEK